MIKCDKGELTVNGKGKKLERKALQYLHIYIRVEC